DRQTENHMSFRLAILGLFVLVAGSAAVNKPAHPPAPAKGPAGGPLPAGWKAAAPRDEISPQFGYDATGGRDGKGAFVITADAREGQHGWFQKSFPIPGGKHYKFSAGRKVSGVAVPRRSASVRILWQDDNGKSVPMSEPAV